MSAKLSLAFGVTPVKPHGYAPISSEWASTFTVTVRELRPGLVSLRPNRTARWPSGAKSVRSTRRPAVSGRSSFV